MTPLPTQPDEGDDSSITVSFQLRREIQRRKNDYKMSYEEYLNYLLDVESEYGDRYIEEHADNTDKFDTSVEEVIMEIGMPGTEGRDRDRRAALLDTVQELQKRGSMTPQEIKQYAIHECEHDVHYQSARSLWKNAFLDAFGDLVDHGFVSKPASHNDTYDWIGGENGA